MTFEEALKALKEGKKVRQKVWQDYEYITLKNNVIVTQSGNISGMFLDSLYKDCWEEVKEDIINTKEREYLRAVIKPFRDRIAKIIKADIEEDDSGHYYSLCICVYYEDSKKYWDYVYFPKFKGKDTMYKGMEVDKEYTLKELGL